MALTVSTIDDTTTAFNTATGALAWTLTGIVGTITLEAVSLNTTVVASANIVFGGSGGSRTVTITPATGQAGFATIVLTATDDNDDLPVTTSFLLTVSPAATSGWTPPTGWEAQTVGPESQHERSGNRYTLEYAAPYATVGTDKPAYGRTVDGYSGVVVLSVKVSPKSLETDNSLAMVTIELGPEEIVEGGGDGDEDFQPIYTRRWERLEKPLLTHPRYLPGSADALTNIDLAQIAAWEREPSPTLKGTWKYTDPDTRAVVTLSTKAQNAAQKLLAGVTSWTYPVPVVSRVQQTTERPLAKTDMSRQFASPPGFPTGTYPTNGARGMALVWLGIEDDAQRQGRTGPWVQTVSFQGLEQIDPDLYPAG